MNKYIYIGLLFVASLYTSCSKDYLDVIPDNVATIDNAFSSKFNALNFFGTLYTALPNPGDVDANPALNGMDEIWYPSHKNLEFKIGPRIAKGNQNATSPLGNKWTGSSPKDLYVAIRNCNIFLSRIDEVKEIQPYENKQLKAEATFLKAYYHFYLVTMYGPVVINDTAIPVSAGSNDIQVARSTVDECFKYIVETMDKAIADLPIESIFKNAELGRVTKPIAMAIKARVLVTYASPLFNGNTVYNDFLNKEGKPLFPQTYDATKWEKAAKAAKEAIDVCQEAGFKLLQKEDYLTSRPLNNATLLRAALRMRVTEKWNSEIIWGHTANTFVTERDAIPRLFGQTGFAAYGRHCAPIGIAETYYSKNGVPIEEDTQFDYDNRYSTKTATVSDQYEVVPNASTAILNFDRENRFYADLGFDRGVWFGNGKELTDADVWHPESRKGEYSSVDGSDVTSITGYYVKKLVSIKTTVGDRGDNLNATRYSFPIIRLADLYLYYAEALNETKAAPDASVYQYIDLVRKRAGLDGVVNSWANFSKNPGKPSSKSGMRDIIRQERMIEMSFEGDRFWDLRRWKLAKYYMNRPIKGWNGQGETRAEYYNVKTLFTPTFSERDYLWPIPENEIIRQPGLIQNPGW